MKTTYEKITTKEIYDNEDIIICPKCGHRHLDSHEMIGENEATDDMVCEECEEVFFTESTTNTTYTTKLIIK